MRKASANIAQIASHRLWGAAQTLSIFLWLAVFLSGCDSTQTDAAPDIRKSAINDKHAPIKRDAYVLGAGQLSPVDHIAWGFLFNLTKYYKSVYVNDRIHVDNLSRNAEIALRSMCNFSNDTLSNASICEGLTQDNLNRLHHQFIGKNANKIGKKTHTDFYVLAPDLNWIVTTLNDRCDKQTGTLMSDLASVLGRGSKAFVMTEFFWIQIANSMITPIPGKLSEPEHTKWRDIERRQLQGFIKSYANLALSTQVLGTPQEADAVLSFPTTGQLSRVPSWNIRIDGQTIALFSEYFLDLNAIITLHTITHNR